MEKLLWGMIFVTEVMKYILGERLLFKRTIERKWSGILGFLAYTMMVWFVPITKDGLQYIVMYAMVIVTVYLLIQQKKVEDVVQILVLLIELTCIDAVIEIAIGYLVDKIGHGNLLYEYEVLLNNCLVLIMLYAVYAYCRRKKDFGRKIKSEYVWVILLVMMINIPMTTAGLYVVKGYVKNDLFDMFFSITNICSYISVALMIFFIIYIRRINQKLQQLLSTEKQLKEVQTNYYCSLLEKEEATRKSRHDWNNHLICLAELAQKENADKTKQYIDTLTKQNNDIIRMQYDVGNDILNAILGYYFVETNHDIDVKIVGRCKKEIQMDATDLCVIVSNLIQNAVEYLRNSNLQEKRFIFSVEEGKVYQRLSIVNSVDSDVSEKNLKSTTKKDKMNHGIGLKNVKEAIERNAGKLEITIQNGTYKAEVILK